MYLLGSGPGPPCFRRRPPGHRPPGTRWPPCCTPAQAHRCGSARPGTEPRPAESRGDSSRGPCRVTATRPRETRGPLSAPAETRQTQGRGGVTCSHPADAWALMGPAVPRARLPFTSPSSHPRYPESCRHQRPASCESPTFLGQVWPVSSLGPSPPGPLPAAPRHHPIPLARAAEPAGGGFHPHRTLRGGEARK